MVTVSRVCIYAYAMPDLALKGNGQNLGQLGLRKKRDAAYEEQVFHFEQGSGGPLCAPSQREGVADCWITRLAKFPGVDSDLDVVVDQGHEARERVCRYKQSRVAKLFRVRDETRAGEEVRAEE